MSQKKEIGQHSVILVLDHLKPGYNIAKIFRTANAFGVQEVFLVGIESFDVRAAMGGFKHTKHRSFKNFQEAYDTLTQEGFEIFALTPNEERQLHNSKLPLKTAFVVGHEEYGLSFEATQFKNVRRIGIPQFGQVQSLNVSIAASIAVYEYLRQHTLCND